MIYSNIQLITIIAVGIALIFGVISIYKKSESPINNLRKISTGLSLFLGFFALIFYLNIFSYALIFIIIIWIYIKGKSNGRKIANSKGSSKGYAAGRINGKVTVEVRTDNNYSELESSSGCLWLVGVIGIGFLMYFVFQEYLEFTIKSETKTSAFDILLILFAFCTILCGTTWTISLIIKSIILPKEQLGFAATSFSSQKNSKRNRNNSTKIIDLISSGKLNEAIIELENSPIISSDKEMEKTIILMKSNWSNVQREYNSGLISFEEVRIEKTRISEKILNLIN